MGLFLNTNISLANDKQLYNVSIFCAALLQATELAGQPANNCAPVLLNLGLPRGSFLKRLIARFKCLSACSHVNVLA